MKSCSGPSGRAAQRFSSFSAITDEFSAANMSRSCASTSRLFGIKELRWPPSAWVTPTTLACFARKPGSNFPYWSTTVARPIKPRDSAPRISSIFFARIMPPAANGHTRRVITSTSSVRIRFSSAEASSSARETWTASRTSAKLSATTPHRSRSSPPCPDLLSWVKVAQSGPFVLFNLWSQGDE